MSAYHPKQKNDKNVLKIRYKIQNFHPESCAIRTDRKIFIFVILVPRIADNLIKFTWTFHFSADDNSSTMSDGPMVADPQKPFLCTLCNTSFTRRDNLRVHMRSHSGERPYICNFCNKAFTRAYNCKQHMQVSESTWRHLGCVTQKGP